MLYFELIASLIALYCSSFVLNWDKSIPYLFFVDFDLLPERQDRLAFAFEDELSGHRAFGVEDERAVAFFLDVLVHVVADGDDRVLGDANLHLVAFLDLALELAARVLDDHLREVRADAFIEQDDALVVHEERARQVADGRDRDFVFHFHVMNPLSSA